MCCACVLDVFGHPAAAEQSPGGVQDVSYINWLLMVRAGLTGLEFYTPATQASLQYAHTQTRLRSARYRHFSLSRGHGA